MVALSLQLVIAQRLVRVNCESCIVDHELLPNERVWLRQELGDKVDGHRYRRGKGCTHGNGTGFLGRTGVYEVLEMTAPVAEAANHEDIQHFIRVAREQMAGNSLRRHAAQLVAAGTTTVEEAMRVSNLSED
jgi:MSHA biogenesis protein MshE